MKQFIIFIIFLMFRILSFSQPQYGYTQIKSKGQIEVCPGEYYTYSSYVSKGNNYQLQWEVSNGVFEDGRTTAYNLVAPRVQWNDNAVMGQLKLTVVSHEGITYNGNNSPSVLNQGILSVRNLTPSIASLDRKDKIPLGIEAINVSLSKMVYPRTTKEITQYEWTLPEGWSSSGKKGVFIAGKSINVKTDYFTEGNISVRAVSNCGRASNSIPLIITFKRPFDFEKYPPSIPYGSLSSYVFKVNDVNISGIQYEWSAPEGWKINNGNDTFIGNSSQVLIQAVNPNSDGKIYVRLRLGNDISRWYVCPYNGIQAFNGNMKDLDLESDGLYSWSDLYLENVNIKSGANITLNGYNSVRIVPGFHAELGSNVRIYNGTVHKALTRGTIEDENLIENRMSIDQYSAKLNQNFPSPAYSITTISCVIPESRINAYLQLCNMMGMVVMKIPITSIGQNSIDINTSELANGIYMYSLIVDGRLIDTKRMIISN